MSLEINNQLQEFIGTWGTYSWFPNQDDLFHHVDDLNVARNFNSIDKVFECIDIYDGQYIVLSYDNQTFRIRPDRYRVLSTPKYKIGSLVTDTVLSRQGIIRDILWHYEREREYYLLTVNGRKSKRWYWSEELIEV